MLKTLMRELVFHKPHDRFACFGSQPCVMHDIRAESSVQFRHTLYDSDIVFGENTPRCDRELHHRHEGMHLRGAHDKRLVELILFDIEECGKLSASYHIRTGIGITQQTCHAHLRNELLHRFPAIVFVS